MSPQNEATLDKRSRRLAEALIEQHKELDTFEVELLDRHEADNMVASLKDLGYAAEVVDPGNLVRVRNR